jgi:hypothetical protein
LGFALIVCSLSLSAFAAKNSQDVTFSKSVKVGSTQLPAGDYKVSWTGADASLQVTIAKNGKTLATTPAKLVPVKNPSVGLGTKTVNGADILQTIQLNKFNLELTNATATGE